MTDNEQNSLYDEPTQPENTPLSDSEPSSNELSVDETRLDAEDEQRAEARLPDETESSFVDQVIAEETASEYESESTYEPIYSSAADDTSLYDDVLPFDDDSVRYDWRPVIEDDDVYDTPQMSIAEVAAMVAAQRKSISAPAPVGASTSQAAAFEAIETEEDRQAREQAMLEAQARQRAFEDLSLAQAAAQLFKAPAATLDMIGEVARTSPNQMDAKPDPRRPAFAPRTTPPRKPRTTTASAPIDADASPRPTLTMPSMRRANMSDGTAVMQPGFTFNLAIPSVLRPLASSRRQTILQWFIRSLAFAFALIGMSIIASAPVPGNEDNLNAAAPYWLIALIVWLVSDVIGTSRSMRESRQAENEPTPVNIADDSEIPAIGVNSYALRAFFGVVTLVLAFFAWRLTSGNLVTTGGLFAWFASMLMAVWTFAPRGWTPLRIITGTINWIRSFKFEFNWVVVALIAITLLGAYFRLSNLDTPPDQTSDHVEKILNAADVLDGRPRVFFSENGGRESIQMYLMAALSQIPLPGLGINFHTLKLLSAFEGIITIPVMFWLGSAIVGREDRRLGNLVGLATAGLVAVSYWHEILSLLGLRIVLTSFITSLLLIFLIRGLRTGNRSQFILAGLTLGIGLYTYQAVRMLPIVVIAGLLIGLLYRIPNRAALTKLIFNGVALVAVAFVCFVPLLGYIVEFPDDFLRRTSTRLLGDNPVMDVDAQGNEISREPTFLEAVGQSAPQFFTNYRNATLAYTFKSDGAWFQSAPFHPLMDTATGALFIVGIAAWIGLMLRRRDPGFDLIFPALFIMLLPSALAVAFPNENPSNTRLSGTLPLVYLLAGYAFAVLGQQTARIFGGKIGFVGVGVLSSALLLGAYSANLKTFRVDYRTEYINSSSPYSVPAVQLREFAENGGSYGNAFIIFYPYWWDHRAIAVDAGAYSPRWDHSITDIGSPEDASYVAARDRVPEWIREAYQSPRDVNNTFDPELPILFFYNDNDSETQIYLERWFPEGTWERVEPSYSPNKPYRVYRLPPLGRERFEQWLADNGSPLQ